MTIRELFELIGNPIHPLGVVFLHEYSDGDFNWIQLEPTEPQGLTSKRFEDNEWIYCQFMDGFRNRPISDWSNMDVKNVRESLLPSLPERYRSDRIEKFIDGQWQHGEVSIEPSHIVTSYIFCDGETVVTSGGEDDVAFHRETLPLILQAPNLYWELKRLDPNNPVLAKARGEA